MDKIEVKILGVDPIGDAEKMLALGARITQRGHKISCMDDLTALYEKEATAEFIHNIAALPHPTLQKLGRVNIAIVGASRRFLGQIRTHQDEVKFVSGSLQYSDYTGSAEFCVPYAITQKDVEEPILGPYDEAYPHYYRDAYLNSCGQAKAEYEAAIKSGIDKDAAGYIMPQGMRNVLLISAVPFELKHMIQQRICRRNTLETMYVMLLIWEELIKLSPMFDDCGPWCMQRTGCLEGKMSCGHFLHDVEVADYISRTGCSVPTAILDTQFKYIRGTVEHTLYADEKAYETITTYKNGDPVEERNK
jgi:thymidylate synthase (FAD)